MESAKAIPELLETVDGVERYPDTGIQVIVVGGGIGGLTAALECWRKGMGVRVLESSPVPSSIGKNITQKGNRYNKSS